MNDKDNPDYIAYMSSEEISQRIENWLKTKGFYKKNSPQVNLGTPDNPIKITAENISEALAPINQMYFDYFVKRRTPVEVLFLPDGTMLDKDGCYYRDEDGNRIDVEDSPCLRAFKKLMDKK